MNNDIDFEGSIESEKLIYLTTNFWKTITNYFLSYSNGFFTIIILPFFLIHFLYDFYPVIVTCL